MLFNDVDQLSYKEIEKATKINSLDLIKCLYSMALVKDGNIIKKEPMNGYIGEDDLRTTDTPRESECETTNPENLGRNVIAEVTKELISLFLPNPTDIKKRIESLIERDYLERDSIDNNLYRYLA
ncbi:cullin protein neddylation domain protein [Medicago truncatula]|uniref:Cullin protein neddylation domain protein n=1 Tax=Medicago truncatula TaxID=3880 RepID=G7KCK8_MEDTR|nr:cullin protein neddylation domain protein [Medicago truncatula]